MPRPPARRSVGSMLAPARPSIARPLGSLPAWGAVAALPSVVALRVSRAATVVPGTGSPRAERPANARSGPAQPIPIPLTGVGAPGVR
jgi:hypothetical protein